MSISNDRDCACLRHRRCAYERVLLQLRHFRDEPRWTSGVPQPPAGAAIVLPEPTDQQHVLRMSGWTRASTGGVEVIWIGEEVIDLVGYEQDVT